MKSTLPASAAWALLIIFNTLGLGPLAAWGQSSLPPVPPPGGYVVRAVDHLEVVSEPPGGLVPYPDSSTGKWGYCDTLGRVWIQPHFAERPSFFIGSFGHHRNDLDEVEGFAPPDHYTFINARGEILRADKATVVVQEADGSLRLRQRRDWLWKPAVYRFSRQRSSGKIVIDTTYGSLTTRPFWRTEPIGYNQGRGIGFHRRTRPPKKGRPPRDEAQRGALLDERGRPLTKFEYWRISPFSGGGAEAQHTGYFPDGGIELIDRQGKKLTRGPISGATIGCRNRVAFFTTLGDKHSRSAIIDTTGRLVRDWQPGWIKWAIPGYFFYEQFWTTTSTVSGKRRYRLLDPSDGHVLLGGQRFELVRSLQDIRNEPAGLRYPSSEGMYYKSCIVRDTTGHWGFLSHDLRWVLPCSAERLVTNLHEPVDIGTYLYSAIFYVRVAGRWGVVDARANRIAVPIRYDSLTTSLQDGWLGAIRDGQPVVLYNGREVAQGWLEVLPSDSYQSRNTAYQTLRRTDQAVTLIDTTGTPVMPWLPAIRLLVPSSDLPDGLVWGGTWSGGEDTYKQKWTLLNREGKQLLPWQNSRSDPRQERYGLLVFNNGNIYTTTGQFLGGELGTKVLSGGWLLLLDGAILREPTGKEYVPPAGWLWSDLWMKESDDYQFAPFERQVMSIIKRPHRNQKSHGNFSTRSGRIIWKSDRVL